MWYSAAYLLENAIVVLSWGGAFALHCLKPTVRYLYERPRPTAGHLPLFQNKMTNAQQMPGGGEWARLELTKPLY